MRFLPTSWWWHARVWADGARCAECHMYFVMKLPLKNASSLLLLNRVLCAMAEHVKEHVRKMPNQDAEIVLQTPLPTSQSAASQEEIERRDHAKAARRAGGRQPGAGADDDLADGHAPAVEYQFAPVGVAYRAARKRGYSALSLLDVRLLMPCQRHWC